MAAFSPKFFDALQRTVRQLAESQELSGVIVTDEARRFLATIIIESALYRGDEWNKKFGLDVGDSGSVANSIPRQVEPPIKDVLGKAVPVTSNGQNYICVVSLVESIKNNWCNVWPFCV